MQNEEYIEALHKHQDKLLQLKRQQVDREPDTDIVYDHYMDLSDYGKTSFYESAQLPERIQLIIKSLEDHSDVIREELNNICRIDGFVNWPEQICKSGWNVFGLYGFGRRLDENANRCPQTVELIESLLDPDELTTVTFSALDPNSYIVPHAGYEGYSDNILRIHLGLVIPNKCGIRVGNEKRVWRPGKCLVFDDMITHEAWNFGDHVRYVLFVDVKYYEKDYMIAQNRELGLLRSESREEDPLFSNAQFTPHLVEGLAALDKQRASKMV